MGEICEGWKFGRDRCCACKQGVSTQFVTENVKEGAALVEKFDIIKAAVAEKAIPYCNIVFVEGEDMKQRIGGYLKALYDEEAASVGGKLPEDDFYYDR